MSLDNDDTAEPTLFSAVITPYRSLSGTGFVIIMLFFGGVSFTAGVFFLTLGAWPVFGFFGLDVALLYWAFRLNYRQAAAYEEITVTPSELTMRRVSRRGVVREWKLNPVWAQLHRARAVARTLSARAACRSRFCPGLRRCRRRVAVA